MEVIMIKRAIVMSFAEDWERGVIIRLGGGWAMTRDIAVRTQGYR